MYVCVCVLEATVWYLAWYGVFILFVCSVIILDTIGSKRSASVGLTDGGVDVSLQASDGGQRPGALKSDSDRDWAMQAPSTNFTSMTRYSSVGNYRPSSSYEGPVDPYYNKPSYERSLTREETLQVYDKPYNVSAYSHYDAVNHGRSPSPYSPYYSSRQYNPPRDVYDSYHYNRHQSPDRYSDRDGQRHRSSHHRSKSSSLGSSRHERASPPVCTKYFRKSVATFKDRSRSRSPLDRTYYYPPGRSVTDSIPVIQSRY